ADRGGVARRSAFRARSTPGGRSRVPSRAPEPGREREAGGRKAWRTPRPRRGLAAGVHLVPFRPRRWSRVSQRPRPGRLVQAFGNRERAPAGASARERVGRRGLGGVPSALWNPRGPEFAARLSDGRRVNAGGGRAARTRGSADPEPPSTSRRSPLQKNLQFLTGPAVGTVPASRERTPFHARALGGCRSSCVNLTETP